MAFTGSRHIGPYIYSGHATQAPQELNVASVSGDLTANVSGPDRQSNKSLAPARTRVAQNRWERLRRALLELLPFWRALLANPRGVASLFPSSRALAHCIAAQVDPRGSDLVLEIGAGTGAVTSALLERGVDPKRLLVIEKDVELARILRERFPNIVVEQADALEVISSLFESQIRVSAIVSGLPLLNFRNTTRVHLIERSLQRLQPGAPFIQLSFGWKPPVAGPDSWLVGCVGVVIRNVPPATVWVYTHALNFKWESSNHPSSEDLAKK